MRARGRRLKASGWVLGAGLLLGACSPGEEGGPTGQDPAASAAASPSVAPSPSQAPPRPSVRAIASAWASPEASATPSASPMPALGPGELLPEAFPRLALKGDMRHAEVAVALAEEGFLVVGAPRTGGQPGPPTGEAWLYAESTRLQAKTPRALWLRFDARPDDLHLRSLQPDPTPAQLAECLGESLDNLNGRQRANALRYAESNPILLRPEGADLVGAGVRLQAPKVVKGRLEVEGTLLLGGKRYLVPMADRRFAEAGHLVGGHVGGTGQRLALLERLPQSGAVVASYWLLSTDGQHFRQDRLDGR